MKNFTALLFVTLFISCGADWSYEGENAPQKWGEIKEEYKFCKIGYNQSPIDVDFNKKQSEEDKSKKPELKFSYSDATLYLEGEKMLFDRKDFIELRKRQYFLNKITFHHPSEHYSNSVQQVLEMQIFHKSDSEQLLILSVFVKVGKENIEINNLISLLEASNKSLEIKINFQKILNLKNEMFFFKGPLTTPPCTEGVKWFVSKTPIQMSKDQINKIIKLILYDKANARPLQEFHPQLY